MRPAISKGAGRKSCVEQRNHLFRSICRATDLPLINTTPQSMSAFDGG
jgi:hypothetical protein